jgi:hypothetical protein
VARVGFEHYEQQGAPPLEQLDRPSQLAMLLAHERPQGADSFFHPYIDALGAQPSAAWAMADAQVRGLNQALGVEATRALAVLHLSCNTTVLHYQPPPLSYTPHPHLPRTSLPS